MLLQLAKAIPQSANLLLQLAKAIPQSANTLLQLAKAIPQSANLLPQLAEALKKYVEIEKLSTIRFFNAKTLDMTPFIA